MDALSGGILGSLLGGIFRLVPEVLKWMDRKDERKHELNMFTEQSKLEHLRGDIKVQEITAQHGKELDNNVMEAFQSAVESQATMVTAAGRGWAASLSASVRPLITYYVLFVWSMIHLWFAMNSGNTAIETFKLMMSPDMAALVAGTINYWFLDRTLAKRGL